MSHNVRRRLGALERSKHTRLSGRAVENISDADLDWMLTLPNDGTRFETELFTAEQVARCDAIWSTAMAPVRIS